VRIFGSDQANGRLPLLAWHSPAYRFIDTIVMCETGHLVDCGRCSPLPPVAAFLAWLARGTEVGAGCPNVYP
jgi:hypothetical protein